MVLPNHTVKSYDDDLKSIAKLVTQMLDRVNISVDFISNAVSDTENDFYNRVKENDHVINDLDIKIEKKVTQMLALRQPMAVDLRYLIAAIKVSLNLERAGDLAKNIVGKIGKVNNNAIDEKFVGLISEMVEVAKEMLRNAIESYNNQDLSKAQHVLDSDEKINADYKKFKKVINDDSFNRDQVIDLIDVLSVAKSLERLGDHAKNIAEISFYVATGKVKE